MFNFFFGLIDRVKAAEPSLIVGTGDKTTYGWSYIHQYINFAIDLLLYFGGGFAAIGFILGALGYITSYGDDAKAAKAKKNMLFNVIGLIVIIMARFIIVFVRNAFMQNTPT